MIYFYRSEMYESIITNHNHRSKNGYSDSGEDFSTEDESSDDSLNGRKQLHVSTRRRN